MGSYLSRQCLWSKRLKPVCVQIDPRFLAKRDELEREAQHRRRLDAVHRWAPHQGEYAYVTVYLLTGEHVTSIVEQADLDDLDPPPMAA
jgi:hypothetical protein